MSVAVRAQFWDLGAGTNPRPEWFAVDLYEPADLTWDLRRPFAQEWLGTVAQAMFYHGPEHYTRAEIPAVLTNVYALLQAKGILELRCPDLALWARQIVREGTVRTGLGVIYGEQSGPGQIHYNGFDFGYLKGLLEATGFVDVRRLSAPGEASIYPYDWAHPEKGGDPARRLDLHVACRKP